MVTPPRQSYQFPRQHRLLSGSQFQPLFDSPSWRVSSHHLLLLVSPNDLDVPRLGMVIGKRRVRRAVDRNQLRRLMRESFRLRTQALAGLDIVILVRATVNPVDNSVINQELCRVWDKLLAKRALD